MGCTHLAAGGPSGEAARISKCVFPGSSGLLLSPPRWQQLAQLNQGKGCYLAIGLHPPCFGSRPNRQLTNHPAAETEKSQSGVERPQCEVRSSYTHTVEAVFRVGPDRSPTAAAATGEPSYTLNSTAAGAAASARLTFGLRANSHRPLQASHGLAG